MPTTVHTDGKDLVTQYARGFVLQPVDPVFLKPKGDPGVAPHFNISTKINNPAGTVYDHKTRVAHSESYMGQGKHVPIVIVGRNTGQVNGDNGFLSFMKNVYIESRNVVMHGVETSVNALWSLLPPAMKNVVQNGGQIAGGMTLDDFGEAAQGEAKAMLEAIKSTDTLIALGQTAALMGVSAIPVVGQIAGGAAVALRVKNAVESTAGAAQELQAMMERWTQPMSPAQIAAERKKLASFLIRVGIGLILAAIGKAMAKVSSGAKGRENSSKDVVVGKKNAPNTSQCACSIGKPVVIATGEKSLTELDFSLTGIIPLDWGRKYRSGDASSGWFGQGWTVPLAVQLFISSDQIHYHDTAGRSVRLPVVPVGTEHFDAYEQFTLRHPSVNRWEIAFKDGLTQHYVRIRDDLFALPLSNITDRNGNEIQLTYPAPPEDAFNTWRPQTITDSAGRVLHLSWTARGQLTQIALRVDDIGPLHVLAIYSYSSAGELLVHTDAAGNSRK